MRKNFKELLADPNPSELDEQRRGLELVFIFTSVESSYKAMAGKVWCHRKAWIILNETFKSMSEAFIDVNSRSINWWR